MCLQTRTPTEEKAATEGGAWLQRDAAERIRCRESAMMRLTVLRKQRDGSYKPHSEVYFVTFLECTREWLLSHDSEGSGSGAGFVDYRLSNDLFDCDCPSAQHSRTGDCKHKRGIARGLKAIGIDPITGK